MALGASLQTEKKIILFIFADDLLKELNAAFLDVKLELLNLSGKMAGLG